MTTDAWKALKRERRRRVCRGIRRTFLVIVGWSLAAIVIYHVVWFRYGWTDLPLRCVDAKWQEWREISGEFQPQAASSFEILLKTLYGEAAVKRPQPGRILVRPVVVMFYDDDRLTKLTTLMTDTFSRAAGSPDTGIESAEDCRLAQHFLMAGGLAESCDEFWQPVLLHHINHDSSPWLTSFFRVEQPSPGQMDNLPMNALPRAVDSPTIDGDVVPDGIECGPSVSHKITFGPIVIVAEIIGLFDFLWSF